jgi:2-polyprenyl-6-methoxyphenol hydroxylase-like FAD-dependent oxidoreductase
VAIACDGINSAIRKQFFPDEGEPRYSGVNMWRGVTGWKPILSGASMVRAGWLVHGKMVIYPIRPAGADGLQLVNWVAEIETPNYRKRDWNRSGSFDDFIGAFADWHFDWLDVPAFIRAADSVLEFPMVDQDPLPRWSFDRITLLGDAAHPMVPRGSNGAGQAILDARALTSALSENGACGLRKAAARGDHADCADQPHQSAGRDPARSVSAHQRQAVQRDRGRHQPRGAGRLVGRLQADCGLFEGSAAQMKGKSAAVIEFASWRFREWIPVRVR